MKIRHYFDGVEKLDGEIDCSKDVVMVKQEFKQECDINQIMKRYENYGVLPEVKEGGVFADVSNCGDFLAAQNVVAEAKNAFASLPASVRDRFRNDPAQLLAFLDDDKNRDEAVKLGLVKAVEKVVPAPAVPVPVVASEPAAPKAP